MSGGRSIQAIQQHAREQGDATRPRWPMIVLRTPKGWTGPKTVDGVQVEGTSRAHQVPIAEVRTNPEHLRLLEEWMRSYRPGELFGPDGAPIPELAALPPRDYRRMSANPHANGGLLLRELNLPEFRDYAVEVARPGATFTEGTRVLGRWLRDVIAANPTSFRLFGPDETASNRLQARHPGTGTRGRGWSAITWPARRWPPSPVAGRWTPRWGSPRWTAW